MIFLYRFNPEKVFEKPCNRFSQFIIHLAISGLAEEDYLKETLKRLNKKKN